MRVTNLLGSKAEAVGTESGRAFRATMPEAYRADFGEGMAEEHARIVSGRRGALVHVEACAGTSARWLCVVTDDRPGLLSLLAVAISAHELEVKDARIYGRSHVARCREAVDFFAVEPASGSEVSHSDQVDLARIRASIAHLFGKDPDIESLARRSVPRSRIRPRLAVDKAPPAPVANVCFSDGPDRDVLVVETEDRPNLLLAITLALYRRRLNIVRSNVSTLDARARDDFEVSEFDGARVSEPRKLAAIGAVVAAIGRVANDQVP